jgi:hypothetical protein
VTPLLRRPRAIKSLIFWLNFTNSIHLKPSLNWRMAKWRSR